MTGTCRRPLHCTAGKEATLWSLWMGPGGEMGAAGRGHGASQLAGPGLQTCRASALPSKPGPVPLASSGQPRAGEGRRHLPAWGTGGCRQGLSCVLQAPGAALELGLLLGGIDSGVGLRVNRRSGGGSCPATLAGQCVGGGQGGEIPGEGAAACTLLSIPSPWALLRQVLHTGNAPELTTLAPRAHRLCQPLAWPCSTLADMWLGLWRAPRHQCTLWCQLPAWGGRAAYVGEQHLFVDGGRDFFFDRSHMLQVTPWQFLPPAPYPATCHLSLHGGGGGVALAAGWHSLAASIPCKRCEIQHVSASTWVPSALPTPRDPGQEEK